VNPSPGTSCETGEEPGAALGFALRGAAIRWKLALRPHRVE